MQDGVSLKDQSNEKPTIDRFFKLSDYQAWIKVLSNYPLQS
jgi:hypothetical protein